MRPANDAVERVATALWNIERRKLMSYDYGPSFYNYADGNGEPMPFHKQPPDFQVYWHRYARRIMRLVRQAESRKVARRATTG